MWLWLSRLHIWGIVIISLLILFIKVVLLPYLFEPIVRKALDQLEASLTTQLNQEVRLGFASLQINVSLDSLFLEIEEPYAQIDSNRLSAHTASLVVGFDRLPELVIDHAMLPVVEHEDGSWSIANIQLSQLHPVIDGTKALETELALPKLIATDTQITFETREGETHWLPRSTFGLAPDLENERMLVSLLSDSSARTRIVGGARIPFDTANNAADFYLQVRNLEHLLQLYSMATDAKQLELNLWGTMSDFQDLKLKMLLSGDEIDQQIAIQDSQEAGLEFFPSPQVRATSATIELDINIPEPLASPQRMSANWGVDASGLGVILPAFMLGELLTLDALEGSGTFASNDGSWEITATDTRVTGPVGTGAMDLKLGQSEAGEVFVDLRASSGNADLETVAALLPLSLSEQGVAFLRRDIKSDSSQLVTIVVRGDDISEFPWPDDEGGEFTFLGDTFGTSLDYAQGYPPLTNADAKFAMRGEGMAVTIVSGEVHGAKLRYARAGIDSLLPDNITLFVNFAADLPDVKLKSLLANLPSTRSRSERFLDDIEIGGSQVLTFSGAFPIYGEGVQSVAGGLSFTPGSHIDYKPLTITLEEPQGQLRFDESHVTGIIKGKALGSGVRMSLLADDDNTSMVFDGTYDIADAMARLGRPLSLPISGKSGVRVRVSGSDVVVDSSLAGTQIDLPDPLGKPAAKPHPLTVTFNDSFLDLSYNNDFIKARIDPKTNVAMFAVGADTKLGPLPAGGTKVQGSLESVDLDTFLPALFDRPSSLDAKLPLEIELELPGAQLFGSVQSSLSVGITVAGAATVASFISERATGEAVIDASGTVRMSLSHLQLPREENSKLVFEEDETGQIATIYVEPGELSPAMPALSVRIDLLEHGDRIYEDVVFAGAPQKRRWLLEEFSGRIGSNLMRMSGDTAIEGQPYTELTVDFELNDLNSFADNFITNSSITSGSGALSGNIAWQGSIIEPHYRTMSGTVDMTLAALHITKDSAGARLLNLFSPFTLLETLSELDIEGTTFDNAEGTFRFMEGDLIIEDLELHGSDVDIEVTGSTNMITELNDINYEVALNASGDVATGAISLLNPLAGGILLIFDKVLDAPLIGKLNLNYKVAGSWDDPEVEIVENAPQ